MVVVRDNMRSPPSEVTVKRLAKTSRVFGMTAENQYLAVGKAVYVCDEGGVQVCSCSLIHVLRC